MARTWMIITENHSHFGDWDIIRMPDYFPVSIYKDTTGQYADEECDDDNCVEIPVPNDLLKQWWYECLEFDRDWGDEPEGGWAPVTDADFLKWVWEVSTCDDSQNLYEWLCDHNYFWKRLD